MNYRPVTKELHSSQIPARHLLISMGYHYLPPDRCLALRGRNSEVLLKNILIEVLKTRMFTYKGEKHPLSPNAIDQIIRELMPGLNEGHRSQGGETHERMHVALPNAAYIAFTGTPLLKDNKTTRKFGPIVHAYTMKRAVEDGTMTPLLYEERKPELDINQRAIDKWFDKITDHLGEGQKR